MIKQLKRAILITDKKLFGGVLAKALDRNKEDFFHNISSVTLFEPVSDLILMQTDECLYRMAYSSDSEDPLVCDRNLQIVSGLGSLKKAYESDEDLIATEVRDTETGADNGEIAESEEIPEIRSSCKNKTGNYYCILFPPAAEFFGDIVKDIASFEADNIFVRSFEEIETTKESLSAFVRAIYAKDSIRQKDLETKLSHIVDATEKYVLGIVSIDVTDPRYRAKKDNGMPEPAAIIDLKNAIRAKYRDAAPNLHKEYKYEYAHDVVIHTTDNYIINTVCRDAVSALKQGRI
ncbi:MAG: hypothetical protein IJJ67_07905 [Oscillospiraceae bacterium]|nr:hypothetical protein [Oscillospiraceae bacterium]